MIIRILIGAKKLDIWLESKTIRTASALLTVSPLLAEKLALTHGKKTSLVMNGFDLDDYSHQPVPAVQDKILRIAYTGKIYRSFQDISTLLEACSQVKPELRQNMDISLYGRDHSETLAMAKSYDLGDIVKFKGEVGFQSVAGIQQSADILLFVLSHRPQAEGIFTGKMFEYIGAGRPILGVGQVTSGAVADFIISRGAGVVPHTVQAIKAQLEDWLAVKEAGGVIPPTDAKNGLSRQEQFQIVEDICLECASDSQ